MVLIWQIVRMKQDISSATMVYPVLHKLAHQHMQLSILPWPPIKVLRAKAKMKCDVRRCPSHHPPLIGMQTRTTGQACITTLNVSVYNQRSYPYCFAIWALYIFDNALFQYSVFKVWKVLGVWIKYLKLFGIVQEPFSFAFWAKLKLVWLAC